MSSFFTLPASQRKRKRSITDAGKSSSKKSRGPGVDVHSQRPKPKPSRLTRDESISSSESDDVAPGRAGEIDGESTGSSESEYEDETAAERRTRLAERYLQNIKGEIDEAGFDAADLDRDLIAERLKEDVAETKGRLYRYIASEYNFQEAFKFQFRADTLTTTSIASCPPYVYTVSKDLTLIKWRLPPQPASSTAKSKNPLKQPPPPTRGRPEQLLFTKGNKSLKSADLKGQHHTSQILCVAASSDGRFVATGGADKKLIIWDAESLIPLRVFAQHRDAILGLAFRHGTNQLYSGSKDRTIKTWSLNEFAYVETLFGHQDEVVDVVALSQERCLSVGARDRTVRLWKVVEETQLVFRGGGGGGGKGSEKPSRRPDPLDKNTPVHSTTPRTRFTEGSIDRIAMIDTETFITGSDNGSLCLWTHSKKKPIFTISLAHGLDPALTPEEASAEADPERRVVSAGRQPRWITALASVPFSDLVVSGSWDGNVRVWRISEDRKRIEAVGILGGGGEIDPSKDGGEKEEGADKAAVVKGLINDISIFERGDRGKDGLCVVAAVGAEHRLGRWKKVKGKNGAVVFYLRRKETEKKKKGKAGGKIEEEQENKKENRGEIEILVS
ncbi:MAG: pre-rRNA processing protein [Icmadophila ericetorum]|nr:pre-rRNA processing protein [Icmadophila ericetorum]